MVPSAASTLQQLCSKLEKEREKGDCPYDCFLVGFSPMVRVEMISQKPSSRDHMSRSHDHPWDSKDLTKGGGMPPPLWDLAQTPGRRNSPVLPFAELRARTQSDETCPNFPT